MSGLRTVSASSGNGKSYDSIMKILLIGDSGVGKSCLLVRFVEDKFNPSFITTIGIDFKIKTVDINGKKVKLQLWDTAGQEDYDRLRPLSYPDSNVVLICFSIDLPDSLENVQEKWIAEVLHFCQGVPIILVGCKVDLRNDPQTIEQLRQEGQQPVTSQEGQSVADQIGATGYYECSAKTGYGVREVFEAATRASLMGKSKTNGKAKKNTTEKKKKKCVLL